MIYLRRNVFGHDGVWNDTLHWYAIGVRELRRRPFTDRTSWRFLAAIHSWDLGLWQILGELHHADSLPNQADQANFLRKCQHGSWYFLPWHRGYLSAFERIVRAAIVTVGGPNDWALPYWNYSQLDNPDARTIPPAFAEERMPDGTPNALYSPYRFGVARTGELTIPKIGVSLDALAEPAFGSDETIAGGFGGGRWPVAHSGRAPGNLEGRPHGDVHVAIGGNGIVNGQPIGGLMASFASAGLDPIFWLHHANIDRLWEVWCQRDQRHKNPRSTDWLGGPADKAFVVPDVTGEAWRFGCADVVDTTSAPLNYRYDDISDPLGLGGGRSESLNATRNVTIGEVKWEERDTQLLAASTESVPIGIEGATLEIQVSSGTLRLAADKMLAESLAPHEVERYFLLLDHVHGADNTSIYEVFVDYGQPGQLMMSGQPREVSVGTLNSFGIETSEDGESVSPPGLSRLYNITPVIERMGLDEDPDLGRLHVRLLPITQNEQVAPPTIGRIAIYRETA